MGRKPLATRPAMLSGLLMVSCLCFAGAERSFRVDRQVAAKAAPCAGAEPHLRAGEEALDQGDLAEAERLLTPLEKSHSRCAEVLLSLARLRALQKDPLKAQVLFSRALELAPEDARPYYYFAQFQLSQGEYRQADYYSEQAASRDPTYPDALMLRGQILSMKGQIAAAREMLEKACRLDPKNPEAHFQLGVLFDSRQLHPEAVQQFENVIALRPHDARAYDYLALNLEALGEPKEAEAAYEKGLQINKGSLFDSFLDYNYGRFLMKANRLAESMVHLDRAVRLAPDARAVYYERARLNLRLQKSKEAEADAERALSLTDPSGFVLDLQVYYLLATIYTRLGDTERAQKYAALCRSSRIPIQSQGRGDR
jgi:tetratricopeptide (TPR) repeat protein